MLQVFLAIIAILLGFTGIGLILLLSLFTKQILLGFIILVIFIYGLYEWIRDKLDGF